MIHAAVQRAAVDARSVTAAFDGDDNGGAGDHQPFSEPFGHLADLIDRAVALHFLNLVGKEKGDVVDRSFNAILVNQILRSGGAEDRESFFVGIAFWRVAAGREKKC